MRHEMSVFVALTTRETTRLFHQLRDFNTVDSVFTELVSCKPDHALTIFSDSFSANSH